MKVTAFLPELLNLHICFSVDATNEALLPVRRYFYFIPSCPITHAKYCYTFTWDASNYGGNKTCTCLLLLVVILFLLIPYEILNKNLKTHSTHTWYKTYSNYCKENLVFYCQNVKEVCTNLWTDYIIWQCYAAVFPDNQTRQDLKENMTLLKQSNQLVFS